MLAAGALGVLAGHLATAGIRAHVERASQDLVAMAKRLAAGEARLVPVRSDIAEIDTVSEVMTRRAHDMTKSLAAERDFASDASHQLRTPLTALLMRLEEISLTDDAEVVKEEATIAIAQVERLTRVVDDLLGRTRGSGGPAPAVSLDSVIAALQREWQPAFEQARRSVRVQGRARPLRPLDPGRPLAGALDPARELPRPRPRHGRRARPPVGAVGRRGGQRPG